MGKCSGLKGGGHHRRALDVAAQKKTEKADRKKERVLNGTRAVVLRELLTEIDPDCDLYLDAASASAAACFDSGSGGGGIGSGGSNGSGNNESGGTPGGSKKSKRKNAKNKPGWRNKTNNNNDDDGAHANGRNATTTTTAAFPDVCRKHFLYDSCTNKRCRNNKDLSIAVARDNVLSGTNDPLTEAADDRRATMPALRCLPGIAGSATTKPNRTSRPILRRPNNHNNKNKNNKALNESDDPEDPDEDRDGDGDRDDGRRRGLATTALSEGSAAMATVVDCLESDVDVVSFGSTCYHFYRLVLEGRGCPSVAIRKRRCEERRLRRRNEFLLLRSRALGGALRYAVGYLPSSSSSEVAVVAASPGTECSPNNNKKKKKNKKKPTTTTATAGGGTGTSSHRRPTTTEPTTTTTTLRPVLLFDHENPSVYEAAKASWIRNRRRRRDHHRQNDGDGDGDGDAALSDGMAATAL